MMEMRWRISTPFSGVSGMPAMVAVPEVGAISVPSVRTVVVLPAPLGPRKPNTSPWATSKETSEKAVRWPKRLVSRSTRRAGWLSRTLVGRCVEARLRSIVAGYDVERQLRHRHALLLPGGERPAVGVMSHNCTRGAGTTLLGGY